MATVEKQFGFNGTTEAEKYDSGRWAFNANGSPATTRSSDGSAADSANDSGANGHSLAVEREGKNLTAGEPYWEWTGTLEQLGVPSGQKVTAINGNYDWRCDVYSTGAASTAGPLEIRDEAGTLLKTISTSNAYSSTTAFATKTGANQTGLTLKSTDKIKIRLWGNPKTGNSNSGNNRVLLDWLVLTITYEAAAGGKELKQEVNDTASLADNISRAPLKALADSVTLADGISKASMKSVADTVSLVDSVSRGTGKRLSDTVSLADAVSRAPKKMLADNVALADGVVKSPTKFVNDTVALQDSVSKAATLLRTDSVSLSDAVSLKLAKQIADEIALGDSVSKAVAHTVADAVALEDSVALGIAKLVQDSAALADTISKNIQISVADVVALEDFIEAFLVEQVARMAGFGDQSFADIAAAVSTALIVNAIAEAVVQPPDDEAVIENFGYTAGIQKPLSSVVIDSVDSEATHP